MKDREKQIEEVETIIKSNLAEGSFANAFARKVASQIVEHYQSKLPEDSVVLSADEFANLKKYAYEKGSKETAEQIINPLLDVEVIDGDYKQFFLDVCGKLEELADKHGVEIKE